MRLRLNDAAQIEFELEEMYYKNPVLAIVVIRKTGLISVSIALIEQNSSKVTALRCTAEALEQSDSLLIDLQS